MKETFWYRSIFFAVLLAFSLMLSGKAIACFAPSAMEMGQGKAMDCCLERCRMETTPAAAKKACEESRLAFSQQDFSSPNKMCDPSAEIVFSDFNPLALFSSPLFEPNDRINPLAHDPPIKRHAANLPIYTVIQTFLI